MTKKPRTPRTAAFKKKIALEALREDKTLSQLASEHGIHPLQVGKWKKELIDGAESLFESKKDRKHDEVQDREDIEKKVGRLTMENDFLKKNSATDHRGEEAMGRGQTHRSVSGSSRQVAEHLSFQSLLQARASQTLGVAAYA